MDNMDFDVEPYMKLPQPILEWIRIWQSQSITVGCLHQDLPDKTFKEFSDIFTLEPSQMRFPQEFTVKKKVKKLDK
jgi:hypothetical protein